MAAAAGCSTAALAEAHSQLGAALGGDTSSISALRILHLYLERLGADFQVLHSYFASQCAHPPMRMCSLFAIEEVVRGLS